MNNDIEEKAMIIIAVIGIICSAFISSCQYTAYNRITGSNMSYIDYLLLKPQVREAEKKGGE